MNILVSLGMTTHRRAAAVMIGNPIVKVSVMTDQYAVTTHLTACVRDLLMGMPLIMM